MGFSEIAVIVKKDSILSCSDHFAARGEVRSSPKSEFIFRQEYMSVWYILDPSGQVKESFNSITDDKGLLFVIFAT